MPAHGSPAVRRRRLAAELRALRASTGRTASAVGQALGWSKAKISRYELARGGLKPADVALLLDFYGVQGSHRAQLLELAEEATAKGWWDSYADVLTVRQLSFIGLEAEAARMMEWQVSVVPGLLQTEKYARQVLAGYQEVAAISPHATERRLQTRLIRQQRLARDEPLELVAVLDECVLRRQRGGWPVLQEQLYRLADASELPNVTIQVLPLRSEHALAADSFAILEFGSARGTLLPDVVSIEHVSDELCVAGDTDINQFKLAFNHIREKSLSPAESRELILSIARKAPGGA